MSGRAKLLIATLILWAPFVVTGTASSEQLIIDPRPPAFLLVLMLIAGLSALWWPQRRLGPIERGVLAVVILLAAVLQVASAVVRNALERPLDLYFDLRHVPSIVGLARDAVPAWEAAAVFVLGVIGIVVAAVAIAWAVGTWQAALGERRRALAALALVLVLLGAGVIFRGTNDRFVSFAATDAIVDQARRETRVAAVLTGYDTQYQQELATPAPTGDLALLAGRDVFLVFFESYGTEVLDNPAWRAVAEPALQDFAASVGESGYQIASSRLVSPVFGGGSTMAHGTMESGLKLDPFVEQLLVNTERPTLAKDLEASGHTTYAVMPGMKTGWPEAGFWGFEHTIFATDLGYRGPPFGWFTIPDQYTLSTFDERVLTPDHKPLFAEIVLVTSHTPFAPVPPFLDQWSDDDPYKVIPQSQWNAIYSNPDWAHLERPYLETVRYDLRALSAWLAGLQGNGLVIILGDHQPPGIASGATAPWTVPVHVLSRDPKLIEPFLRQGYVTGVLPPREPKVKGMESFLGDFLEGFSTAGHG